MKLRIAFFCVILLILERACGSSRGQETGTNLTITPMPTTPTLTPRQLPASARLGANLTGSGVVARSLLNYDDLMTGSATAPVDDNAFALPEEAAMPGVVFGGRLQLSTLGGAHKSKLIRGRL